MPMPSVLVTQVRGGTRAIYRLSGGTSLSPSLGTWGASDPYQAPSNNQAWEVPWNDSVEFNGDIYLSSSVPAGIYVYRRTPAGTVTQVYSSLSTNAFHEPDKTGMYVVNSGGSRYLCFATFNYTLNTWQLIRTTDGVTWTSHNLGASSADVRRPGITVFRGQLIVPLNNTVLFINVAAASMSTVTHSLSAGGPAILAFKGRIFMLINANSVVVQLYELVSGSWVSRANLSLNGNTSSNGWSQAQACLFPVKDAGATDGIKMVAIFMDVTAFNTNIHWRATDIDVDGTTFTLTNRDVLIPTSLRSNGAQANKQWIGFGCFIDNESDPANPSVYLFSWTGLNVAFTHYPYVNSESELIGQLAGMNSSNFGLSGTTWGGGERINTSDIAGTELFITSLVVGIGAVAGTTAITVRVAGDPGNANKTLRGYFSAQESTVMQQMTLAGTATGGVAVRNGNQIDQVDADGITDYTFFWSAIVGDGLSNGQAVNIIVVAAQ